ncbi:MAG: YihY family inner membrane protein [Pseudomonadales bacterium]
MDSNTASKDQHPWVLKALEFVSFCQYVVRRFIDDDCSQNASALTLKTLIALVPLMTVGFAMFSAVPAFENFGEVVQSFVFKHFVPSSGSEIQNYLNDFSQSARNLTVLGIAILGIVAYSTLRNIEKSFNKIWRTREHRKGLSTFLLYWAILSLGPILLGAGLVMTTYLKVFVTDYDVLGVLPYTLRFLPWLLTSLTFTLLFFAVPNCKVPLKHAAIGGFVSGACFEIAKNLFAAFVSNSSYQQIYGTFVTIPLFFVWLQFSWLLVLSGAEIVRALSSYHSRYAQQFPDLVVGTHVLHYFWQQQDKGQAVDEEFFLHQEWLFERSVNREQWERIRNILLKHRVLTVTEKGDFVLTRDLHRLSLWDLQMMMNAKLSALYSNNKLAHTNSVRSEGATFWHPQLMNVLRDQQQTHTQQFSLTLAELFQGDSATGEQHSQQKVSNIQ